jgi:hypothetical protein
MTGFNTGFTAASIATRLVLKTHQFFNRRARQIFLKGAKVACLLEKSSQAD